MILQSSAEVAGKKSARPSKRAASLKRDINLLPANEYSEKIARTGTTVLAVVVGALLLAYFTIVMPTMQLNDLKSNATTAENQVAGLQQADQEFNDLVSQRNTLKQTIDSLKKSEQEYLQPADVMKQLSQACPDNITLTAVTLNGAGMTIDGRAESDKDIAQFIVNLKTIPEYQQISLASVQEDSVNTNVSQKRLFEVKAGLPPAESPDAAATAAPAATTKGGDGK